MPAGHAGARKRTNVTGNDQPAAGHVAACGLADATLDFDRTSRQRLADIIETLGATLKTQRSEITGANVKYIASVDFLACRIQRKPRYLSGAEAREPMRNERRAIEPLIRLAT
jgi:hypothetical protein